MGVRGHEINGARQGDAMGWEMGVRGGSASRRMEVLSTNESARGGRACACAGVGRVSLHAYGGI